ncbi:hypothetical protein GS502_11195 [Rhodococcus hoagii]|nr:hypothetical protein [Prescottella equi]
MTRCNHSGGTGIGAGHVCMCLREAGHPHDSERPHGCECGALWAHKGDTRVEDVQSKAEARTVNAFVHSFYKPLTMNACECGRRFETVEAWYDHAECENQRRLRLDEDDWARWLYAQGGELTEHVTVAVPRVRYKGPCDTDASALLQAAQNLERGYKVGGSNVTAAVVELLRRVARELTDDPRTTSERRRAGA